MMRADDAIARLRRDLALGSALKWGLLAGAMLSMFVEAAFRPQILSGPLLLALIGVVWLVLSYRSMKGSRLAAESPALIAAGQFDLAEESIARALRSFSLFRTVKLRSMHHLAALRHAQKRWQDSAMLCQALLKESPEGLASSTRLYLAESLLELNDVKGAYQAVDWLYGQRLGLAEALELLAIQTDYLWRVEAWEELVFGIEHKVNLAELMNTTRSARTQGLLALAAKRTGRTDWERWLVRRAELLSESGELVEWRPVLRELWPQ